jgi:large subunit ribosomal protein L21
MYAIVKTGGKQYRVERGQRLLIESLEPILYRSDEAVFDRAGLERVKVTAKVLAHVRGEKLRVFKFKPKRGYKRRNGHRQDLTQIEVTEIALSGSTRGASKAEPTPSAGSAKAPAAKAPAAKAPAAKAPAGAEGPTEPQATAAAEKPSTAKAKAAKPAAVKAGEKATTAKAGTAKPAKAAAKPKAKAVREPAGDTPAGAGPDEEAEKNGS